jgi:FAD/FMN-containing dehydrogenase
MNQDDSIRVLRSQFRGALITPADGAKYDSAREVFNAMFDRRPSLIAQPIDAADVAAAIAFARETDTPFAVRGGGHSIAGYSSCESGLVLDLRALKRVAVDPSARRVRAQGGVNWGEFDRSAKRRTHV